MMFPSRPSHHGGPPPQLSNPHVGGRYPNVPPHSPKPGVYPRRSHRHGGPGHYRHHHHGHPHSHPHHHPHHHPHGYFHDYGGMAASFGIPTYGYEPLPYQQVGYDFSPSHHLIHHSGTFTASQVREIAEKTASLALEAAAPLLTTDVHDALVEECVETVLGQATEAKKEPVANFSSSSSSSGEEGVEVAHHGFLFPPSKRALTAKTHGAPHHGSMEGLRRCRAHFKDPSAVITPAFNPSNPERRAAELVKTGSPENAEAEVRHLQFQAHQKERLEALMALLSGHTDDSVTGEEESPVVVGSPSQENLSPSSSTPAPVPMGQLNKRRVWVGDEQREAVREAQRIIAAHKKKAPLPCPEPVSRPPTVSAKSRSLQAFSKAEADYNSLLASSASRKRTSLSTLLGALDAIDPAHLSSQQQIRRHSMTARLMNAVDAIDDAHSAKKAAKEAKKAAEAATMFVLEECSEPHPEYAREADGPVDVDEVIKADPTPMVTSSNKGPFDQIPVDVEASTSPSVVEGEPESTQGGDKA